MIRYTVAYENKKLSTFDEAQADQWLVTFGGVKTSEEVTEDQSVDIPQVVTPRQMRVALIMSGISIASIEAMIDSLPEPDQSVVRTTWEYSTTFERQNPILNSMVGNLNLTQDDVDNLFILAESL